MMEACGDGSTGRMSPGAASPNWNARASSTMVRPGHDRRRDDAQELHLLLRRRRRAQPVAGLEIGDGLPGDRKRRAHHARHRHHEEHARGARKPEPQQHHGRNDDGQHGHARHRIPRRGGDGVGGHRREEEREDQRQRQPAARSPPANPTDSREQPPRDGADHTPSRMAITEMSRSVRSPGVSPRRKARRAMPNDPATMRMDFRIPKIPAVAMAPTPTKRT